MWETFLVAVVVVAVDAVFVVAAAVVFVVIIDVVSVVDFCFLAMIFVIVGGGGVEVTERFLKKYV